MIQDLFIAATACALGVTLLLAGVFNWDWCYQLRKTQWVETRWGRSGARAFLGGLGVVLILLGLAIGFSSQKKRRRVINARHDSDRLCVSIG